MNDQTLWAMLYLQIVGMKAHPKNGELADINLDEISDFVDEIFYIIKEKTSCLHG